MMCDEIFDVVDERDRAIGRLSRRDVHRFCLRHRAAHVLVFDGHGRLFLQRRSLRKDCFPGLWDSSAAGHVESGEGYLQCAVRELREELGLVAVETPIPILRLEASASTGWEFVWVFRSRANQAITLDPLEIEEGRWFTRKALSEWIVERPKVFTDTLRLIWPHLEADWNLNAPDLRFYESQVST